mmetsp:Transcript_23366/g.36184  ORF Transcript_23366/g.36184 Transcript_23366/m.36184 type:complete len:579 (-) Transcript_23366:26-1762(-)
MPSHWQQRYPSEKNEDNDINAWIEEVKRRADANETYDVPAAAPADADVADIIARMEEILNTTEDQNVSFNFDDYLELDGISDEDSLTQTSPDDLVVETVRHQSNDKLKKRCFDELVRHCKSEKKRLGWIEKLLAKQQRMKLQSKYILRWKSINRMIRLKEVMRACKIGRATSNRFRRAFVEWKRLMLTRREQLAKVECRLRRKMHRRTFSALMQNKEASFQEMDRARDRFECKRKAKILFSWRMLARKQRKLNEKAEAFHRARVMRQCFEVWSLLSRAEGGPPSCEPVQVQTPANNHDKLLRPLRKSRRRSSRSNSSPKLLTDMTQRNEERLQRREVLRSRKEHAAIAKKQLLYTERHSKEERELRVHREYLEKKKDEKERKVQEAIRYREASRLAALHYKFSLQKKYLLQWKRIFGINGWNKRKADVFLRDAIYERYFAAWYKFSKNKALRLEKRHYLALDFYECSLKAKAFASLEENVKHSNHLYNKAASRISALRKQTVLREWHQTTLLLVKEREAKEIEARRAHQTFLLRRALHAWKVGVDTSKEDKRVEQLVEEKYAAMMEWLEESRNDNDPY